MGSLLEELRRRNVFKITVAYLAMAWLLVQIADTIFPAFDIAPWALRAIIISLGLGLPLVIAAAWRFELTPEGVKPTESIPEGISYTRQTGRKLDFAIIVFLSLALTTVVIDQYVLEHELTPGISTIAVLPLTNLSGNPDEDYFVDGMTEALITNISRINALRVISRTSVMRFRNSERSLPAIAAELGADAVITGSASRNGHHLRLSVQLVEASTDTMLWGESFESDIDDVFATQREIAQAIVDRIEVDVTPDEMAQLARSGETSANGYDEYLKGMERFYRLTPQDLELAIEYFDRSLELNPESALAHGGIAAAWIGLQQMGFVSPSIAGPNAEAAAMRALEIDPELAEAYLWLAIVRAWSNFDWITAESFFQRSIELNPSYGDTRGSYGHLLAVLGRFDEALEQIETGLTLDPFNGWITGQYGVVYHMSHRYEEALDEFEKAIRLSPDLPFVWVVMAGSYHYSGRYEEAIQAEASYLAALGMTDARETFLRQFADSGYQSAMRWLADLLAEQSRAINAQGTWAASRYAHAGDDEKVIEWLQIAYQQHDPNIAFLRMPEFDHLYSDPRIVELIQKLGIQ